MTPDSAHSSSSPEIPTRDVPAIPIPGWAVTLEHGDFIAVRETPVTRYQADFGAKNDIITSDAGELWLLVDAQTRLAERLATAEAHHRVGHQRRVEAIQSQARSAPES